jgi:hypothetical protein
MRIGNWTGYWRCYNLKEATLVCENFCSEPKKANMNVNRLLEALALYI